MELISPAGPQERGSIQTGAGTGRPSASSMWPSAARCSSASSGSVTVLVRPSGSTTRSRSAASQVVPVTCSTSRPATTKPALL